MGSVVVSCNRCGRQLPKDKNVETIYIKGIPYRMYNSGEYYEKFYHWGKYQCWKCFYQFGEGKDKFFPTQETKLDEFRRESKEFDQEVIIPPSVTEIQTTSNGNLENQFEKVEITDVIREEGTPSLISSSIISAKGGVLRINDTGVELHIPANAFGEKTEHQIDLKVIPPSYDGSAMSFEDHSMVMVELLPDKLTLKEPSKLILPHCLKLKQTGNCEVRVFESHHEAGQTPLWEDITESVNYSLLESRCEIYLNRFCWIKCTARGADVIGKKLKIYAIGEHCEDDAEYVTVDVGYYPDLPGSNEVYQEKRQNKFLGDVQSFLFFKEPQSDLKISLDETQPPWERTKSFQDEMKISYEFIEAAMEQSYPIIFRRDKNTSGLPRCVFTVSQEHKLESRLTISFTPQRRQSSMVEEIIVAERMIHYLSSRISAEWRDIGRYLGTQENNLHSILTEEGRHQDKVYRMLNEWKQREGRNANIHSLQAALRDAGRADLADQLRNGKLLNSLIESETVLGRAGGTYERHDGKAEANQGRGRCFIL